MSLLKRFLGIAEGEGSAGTSLGETESVRRIASQLENKSPEQARYLAAFAYVLARVAHADLELEQSEIRAMEQSVAGLGELAADDAALVCELACDQSARLGGSQNYLVTREFGKIASREQRVRLLECLFAVAVFSGGAVTVHGAGIDRQQSLMVSGRGIDQTIGRQTDIGNPPGVTRATQ